jgi:hypothetical protein
MPKMKFALALAATLGVGAALSMPAQAADLGGSKGGYSPYVDANGDVVYSLVTVSGGEITNGAWESYSGAYFSFNRDFNRDGFFGRIYGSYGSYEDSTAFTFEGDPGRLHVDGDYWTGDLMLGYMWVRGGMDISLMLGAEYQERKSTVMGFVAGLPVGFGFRDKDHEWGLKVGASIETNGNDNRPIYFALEGTYSTAFESYYALGRLGYDFGRFTFGPEVWALGDDSGDAQRVGGFLKVEIPFGTTYSTIIGSGGYQFANEGIAGEFGAEGAYATVELRTAFGESRAPLK